MMKHVLVLVVLVCAAFAAPAEDKDLKTVEAAKDAPEEQEAAVANAAVAPVNTRAAAGRFNFCPNGWFFYGSRCFQFVHTAKNWFSAEEHCNSLGGHLASAHSPSEYRFLQQLTENAGQTVAWIGGFYLQGRWLWSDLQGIYYTNWVSQSSATSNSCVYLIKNNGWSNTACSTSYQFICSKNPFSC